jgi:hypothetical protein
VTLYCAVGLRVIVSVMCGLELRYTAVLQLCADGRAHVLVCVLLLLECIGSNNCCNCQAGLSTLRTASKSKLVAKKLQV